jgi:hypothetical protein
LTSIPKFGLTPNTDLLEAKRIVEEHRGLLTIAVDHLILQLVSDQEDEIVRNVLTDYRHLLDECRQEGIDRAFTKRILRVDDLPPGIPSELLRHLISVQFEEEFNALWWDHPELDAIFKQSTVFVKSEPGFTKFKFYVNLPVCDTRSQSSL